MSLFLRRLFRRASSKRPDPGVERDADALIQHWGEAAYDRATYLSWEEDTGFVLAPQAGHWWNVRCELRRRLEMPDRDPRATFSVHMDRA